MTYPPSTEHCADCNCLLRVSGPCLHGGEWRCWNCVPAAKERQTPPPYNWRDPSPAGYDGRWRWLGLAWSGKVLAGRKQSAKEKRAARARFAAWFAARKAFARA